MAALGVGVWWLLALDGHLALWPEAAFAGLLVVGAALVGKVTGLAAADAWLWWVGRRFPHEMKPVGERTRLS